MNVLCGRCKTSKPDEEFWRAANKTSGRQSWCKECARAERPNRDGAKVRTYQWRGNLGRYGLTPETYNEMVLAQCGGCAVCGGTNPDGRRLHIDHDHATSQLRGLLCNQCNLALGHARDSLDILAGLYDYLKANS